MKRVISLLLAVALLCTLVPTVAVRAETSLSYTDLLLDINWTNIDHVGRQTPYSDSCSCFALAYSRTILDNTVHYFYEYNEYGNTEYSVNALWYVGQHNSAVYSSSNEVFKKLYSDLCNGKPVIVYVTGRGSSGHYITVVGFQNISSLDNLSEYNFLIIDPVFNDGHVAVNMGVVGYSLNSYRQVVYDQSSARVTFSAANNLACSHNYTFADTSANCTQDGLREYTCSSCGDTYSEPIEALGHNYIGVKTEATCDTAGYTTYTCSRCGDSYVEPADGWSEWSTVYPADIDPNLIEQKTQYSTLEKEYTTAASDTLDGWTNIGTTYGEWDAVQTTTTKPTESETLRIINTTQTGWGYYHWCSYYDGTYCIDSIQVDGSTQVEWHEYTSSFELPIYTIPDMGGQQSYGGDGNGASACSRNFYIWFRNYDADVYTYTYQTRSEVNQFYKWSDEWSDWLDNADESSEDIQVKTQTVYRYYIGELADHNYSYTVTMEPTSNAEGVLTGTCSGCSDTATVTLPMLNTVDYTYSVITEPNGAQPGTGRYTWNNTDYGIFHFEEEIIPLNLPKYDITNAAGTAGKTVEVYISIANNPGIISLRNTVSYDSEVLELVKVEDTKLLAGYTTPSAAVASPYTLRWADALATENNDSNGEIVKLTFRIRDSAEVGTYAISVAHVEARDTNGQKVSFYGATASITVIDYISGDTDGDGEISDWDAIVLNRYLAGWNVEIDQRAADVDGDGAVSDWDAIILERYLSGWDVELKSGV